MHFFHRRFVLAEVMEEIMWDGRVEAKSGHEDNAWSSIKADRVDHVLKPIPTTAPPEIPRYSWGTRTRHSQTAHGWS